MVRAALAQFSGNREKEPNILKAEAMTRTAAAQGAQIICFPELASTMYFCYDPDPRYLEWAEPIPGPAVRRIQAVARETGIMIVYPIFEVDDGRYFNSAAIIGPDGDLVGRYRKNSIPAVMRVEPGEPPSNEKFFFQPGDTGFPVFETPFGIRLGVLICYDRHFPEAPRSLALKGAHLIFVPTASFREWCRDTWSMELRTHALENCLYVGGVNKVGLDVGGSPHRFHFGNAVFADPLGNIVSEAGRDADGIVYADIDPAAIDDAREIRGFLGDRRPELYDPITDPRISIPTAAAVRGK